MNPPVHTRDLLLEATRRCVRDGGLGAATSRRITEEAGANLAAITYHFGSKDDLIAEALFGELERRVEPALTLLDGPGEPTELMMLAVVTLLEEFRRSRRDTTVYLDALLLAARDGRRRRSALRVYRSLGERLAAIVRRLRDDGIVPTWVDPEAMASLILGVANGVALQTALDPGGPGIDAMAGQFASLLLATAQPPPADRTP